MQQTCAPLGRPRQTSATRLTNAAGPIGDDTKNQLAPRLAGSRRHTQRGRPGSRRGKTYRDVDTGVSWDAP